MRVAQIILLFLIAVQSFAQDNPSIMISGCNNSSLDGNYTQSDILFEGCPCWDGDNGIIFVAGTMGDDVFWYAQPGIGCNTLNISTFSPQISIATGSDCDLSSATPDQGQICSITSQNNPSIPTLNHWTLFILALVLTSLAVLNLKHSILSSA